mmetsp:Transcript_3995/g.10509  ORF Transcript_3995/g.10509 Transcript_3995/m.10509 type:complete len:229 (-) Transcript_3995:194-880(-)
MAKPNEKWVAPSGTPADGRSASWMVRTRMGASRPETTDDANESRMGARRSSADRLGTGATPSVILGGSGLGRTSLVSSAGGGITHGTRRLAKSSSAGEGATREMRSMARKKERYLSSPPCSGGCSVLSLERGLCEMTPTTLRCGVRTGPPLEPKWMKARAEIHDPSRERHSWDESTKMLFWPSGEGQPHTSSGEPITTSCGRPKRSASLKEPSGGGEAPSTLPWCSVR